MPGWLHILHRVEALCVSAATSIAVSGACGVELGNLPLEKIGWSADIVAGLFFVWSKWHVRKEAH